MHALCRPLWSLIVLALALVPFSVWAADEPILLAQADPSSDTGIEEELQDFGGSVAPPSDVEVFRVKGRAVTAVEQDVPESATRFDAAEIEALGAQSIEDLAKVTPNVEIRTAGATTPTFFIRGVGLADFGANAPGAVAIYQDKVPINAPAIQLGLLFDLENVDIQRGPQGDGPYRNASGGAIQMIGRKPTGSREAYLTADYGNYEFFDVQGAVEIPLTEESLQARVSFRYRERQGFYTNRCGGVETPFADRFGDPAFDNLSLCGEAVRRELNPNDPSAPREMISTIAAGLDERVGNQNEWAARGYLRWQPPETEMDFIFNVHGSRLDQDQNFGQAIGTRPETFGGLAGLLYRDRDIDELKNSFLDIIGPGPGSNQLSDDLTAKALANDLDPHPFRGDFNRVGRTTRDAWGTYLEANVPVGDNKLRSITGYEWYLRTRNADTDFTPNQLFEQVGADTAWQLTQDLQLSGEMDDTPLKWTVGGFYLMQDLKSENVLFTEPVSQNRFQAFSEKLYSMGVYAMADWEFLDDFKLHVGGRYNWEQKTFALRLTRLVSSASGDFPVRTKTWTAPTGTVALNYRVNDLVSVYWKYNRGFKGGHFNAATTTGQETPPAEPESIDAFEIGMTGAWFDRRVALESSLFYYGYDNYQVFIVTNQLGSFPTLRIINANVAEVYGLEATLRLEPVDSLIVTTRFGWLQSTFLDFTNDRVVIAGGIVDENGGLVTGNVRNVADFSGNTLINSPQFKVSLSATYTISLGRFGDLIPYYDASWSDDVYFDATEGKGVPNLRGETFFPENAIGQRAFWLHNLRLTYRLPTGNMEISAWVRNLTDQVYKTYGFDASSFFNLTVHFPGAPRTYGGSVNFSW